jgi:hypothetical protein
MASSARELSLAKIRSSYIETQLMRSKHIGMQPLMHRDPSEASMDHIERYKRKLELIMQGLHEKEALQKQAHADEILNFVYELTKPGRIQRALQLLEPEARQTFINTRVRQRFPHYFRAE